VNWNCKRILRRRTMGEMGTARGIMSDYNEISNTGNEGVKARDWWIDTHNERI